MTAAAVNLNASRATTTATMRSNSDHEGNAANGEKNASTKGGEKSLMESTPTKESIPVGGSANIIVSQPQHLPSTTSPTASGTVPGSATNKNGSTAGGSVSQPNQKPGTNGKAGPTSERDSINALLSLGRDLQGSESEGQDPAAASSSSTTAIGSAGAPKRPPPQPILPAALGSKPSKKRQKQVQPTSTTTVPNAQAGYQYPPDFWYWLPPGESVGEWDVLCGRGGESNNFIGNRKYRKMINERKPAYREIPLKQRKTKTAFVRSIVQHVNNCGGRFVDIDETTGQYYVVTMEKARKKTSQALRETKELKWLDLSETKERAPPTTKNAVCPYCNKQGHKTKIAKACLKHHEWLDANTAGEKTAVGEAVKTESSSHAAIAITPYPTLGQNVAGTVVQGGGGTQPQMQHEIPRTTLWAHQIQGTSEEVTNDSVGGRHSSNSIVPPPSAQAPQAVVPPTITQASQAVDQAASTTGGQHVQDGLLAI